MWLEGAHPQGNGVMVSRGIHQQKIKPLVIYGGVEVLSIIIFSVIFILSFPLLSGVTEMFHFACPIDIS